MPKSNVKSQRRMEATRQAKILEEKRQRRKELWQQINSQEDFENFLPQLRNVYGKESLKKAVKHYGYYL